MGLIRKGAAALAVAGFLCTAGLNAAPRLRLLSSTVGPVSIAQGSNGSAPPVEAYNAADGSLNLSLSSSVSRIVPSKGAQGACSTTAAAGVCTPLQFALNTSALPAGTATGIVTVSDPNAVDAPQTITVTVQIGGAVPSSLDVYVAPGATRDLGFATNSRQIPTDAPSGTSTLQVKRTDGQASNLVSVDIASRAPRLLVGLGLYGVITNLDGSRPMPDGSWPGVAAHPAKAGDTLTLWAIGLGSTSPFVATGQAAPSSEPLARLTTTSTINFGGGIGGAIVNPLFAGLTPGFAGLYQVNVTIPQDVPRGLVYVTLAFGDSTSNPVQIAIQ